MDSVCQCGEQAVDCDSFDGRNVCRGCGFVLSDEALDCSLQLGPEGEQYGHFVSSNGRVSGSGDTGNWRNRNLMKQGETYEMPGSMHTGLTQLAQQLGCNTDVTKDASFLLQQVYTLVSGRGCMPLDTMTAASLFLTIRMANLPYTLAETARLIDRPTRVLALAYQTVVSALNMEIRQRHSGVTSKVDGNTQDNTGDESELGKMYIPPPVDFNKYAHRHLSSLPNLKCSATDKRLIAERFVQLMAWLEQTQRVARHSSLMAAALQLAAEACKVKISAASLATYFLVTTRSVTNHAAHIREGLLVSAAKLPWLKCSRKNVVQHLRTILRVSVPQQLPQTSTAFKEAGRPSDGHISNGSHEGTGLGPSRLIDLQGQQGPQSGQREAAHSKKRQRQAETEHQSDATLDDSHLASRKRPKQTSPLMKPKCKASLTQDVSPHAKPSVLTGSQVNDDSLESPIIASHEWPMYLRSPSEVNLQQCLLQHVQ